MNLNAFALVYADYNATAATDAELEAAFKDKFPTTATAALAAANIKIGTTALTGTQKLHQKIDAATGKAVDGQYVLVDSTTATAVKVYEVTLTTKAIGANGVDKAVDVTLGKEITADAVAGAVDTKVARAGMLSDDKVLSSLDDALTSVSALRSSLGAMQNRFEAAVENLNNTINNLSSARSRIQDADFADEVSRLSNGQILQQAGTTVLAMANQSTQSVLSLLR